MAFPNLYYKRTAATAKACYVCYKPTATVLATIDTADFLYTCPVHLTDSGFATRVPELEPEPKQPSAEEIARVKQEWEEKQRQKKDKEKTDGDDAGKTEGKDKDAAEEKKPVKAPSPSPSPSSSATHERYVLHRNIFALRTADHRRRRQTSQTKNLAPRLPEAPTGSLP